MASMAVAIGALMFSTANALFVRQARADLNRQNQAVDHEIDNLTDRAAESLLIVRNNPAAIGSSRPLPRTVRRVPRH
jgi:hypothetical protein